MRTQFTDSFNFNTVTPAPPVLAAMTAGDDFILGSGAADVLDGQEGDDFIFGLDGADAVRGDVGDLTIDADQPGAGVRQ